MDFNNVKVAIVVEMPRHVDLLGVPSLGDKASRQEHQDA
jgi:hypothetical protein